MFLKQKKKKTKIKIKKSNNNNNDIVYILKYYNMKNER